MKTKNLSGKLLDFSFRTARMAAEKRRRPFCSVILAGGGHSERMGQEKLLLELDGKPVILHTLLALQAAEWVTEIVAVVSKTLLPKVSALCSVNGFDKVKTVISGGESRMESVALGLQKVSPKAELIAVHDAARPFADPAFIDEVIQAAKGSAGAVPALPVRETVKQVENGRIVSTPPRSSLYAAQTPQVFDADLFRAAVEKVKKTEEITDDSMVMEAMGACVSVVPGREYNLKLTTPEDLDLASLILKRRKADS